MFKEDDCDIDNLDKLSEETLINIFSFLPPVNLGRLALVSHSMRRLSEDDALWKRHCRYQNSLRQEEKRFKARYLKEQTRPEFKTDGMATIARYVVTGSLTSRKFLLMKKYVNDTFTTSLSGIDFFSTRFKSQDGNNLRIQLWDIVAELEQKNAYSTMASTYYKTACCYLIVIDLEKGSLEEAKSTLNNAYKRCTNAAVFALIGTYENKDTIQISSENFTRFAQSENISHYSVDINDKVQIDNVFKIINEVVISEFRLFQTKNESFSENNTEVKTISI
jgi:hypothetical protein